MPNKILEGLKEQAEIGSAVFKDKPNTEIVLGLLSSKTNTLDDEPRVIRMLDEASKIIPKERLYLSRQCGFASCDGGNEVDGETGAIRRPITMANSYELPYDPSDINWSSAEGSIYTRNGGANQRYLQEKLALLHDAPDCVVLASGVAALSGVFFAFLKSGDHVVVSDSTYIAAYRLLHELLPEKYNVQSTLVDSSDLEKVKAAK